MSRSAAAVWGCVMTSQNPASPRPAAEISTATSGISTSRLNQIIVTPSARPEPAVRERRLRVRRLRAAPGAVADTD